MIPNCGDMKFLEFILKISDSWFSNSLLRLRGKMEKLTSYNCGEMSKRLTSGTQFFSVGSYGAQCCDCKCGGKERVIADGLMVLVFVISAILVIQLEGKSF